MHCFDVCSAAAEKDFLYIVFPMDEASNHLGNLSLRAAEWKPTSLSPNIDDKEANSDLNAVAVKEFIPGQGWTAYAAAEASVETGEPHGGFVFHLCLILFPDKSMNLMNISTFVLFSNTKYPEKQQ
jgi:hypothetical protein